MTYEPRNSPLARTSSVLPVTAVIPQPKRRRVAIATTSGFSLLELMIAMTITLIITGTMYTFITSSGNAFAREPALSDRQQQIRLAMDRIQQDILIAGVNLGPYFQVFSPDLDGAGTTLGVTANQNTDILQLAYQTNDCPQVRLCPADNAGYAASQDCHNNSKPYSGVNLNFVEPVPSCYPEPGFALILYGDGNAKMGWGWNVHAGGDKFNFPPGQQPSVSQIDNGQQDLGCSLPAGTTGGSCPAANDCGGNAGACAYAIATMDVVRYQIASDPTDNNQPALFRSNTGGFSGVSGSMPTAAAPPGANWQLIARGIEDLQVRYRTRDDGASGSDFWTSSPPVSTGSNPDLIVREVEVTLWSRAIGPGSVTGETTAANGVSAVRGSLTMRASPRASLDNLVGAATNRWQ